MCKAQRIPKPLFTNSLFFSSSCYIESNHEAVKPVGGHCESAWVSAATVDGLKINFKAAWRKEFQCSTASVAFDTQHCRLAESFFLAIWEIIYLSQSGTKKKKQSVRGTIFAYWLTDENNFYLPSSERRFSKYHCRNISGPASLSAPLESATAQATREKKKSTSRKKTLALIHF